MSSCRELSRLNSAPQTGIFAQPDWEAIDRLRFGGLGAGTDGVNYLENTASTYDAARTLATTQIGGGDVVVFADTGNNNGAPEDAVVLVGRSLADIAAGDIGGP